MTWVSVGHTQQKTVLGHYVMCWEHRQSAETRGQWPRDGSKGILFCFVETGWQASSRGPPVPTTLPWDHHDVPTVVPGFWCGCSHWAISPTLPSDPSGVCSLFILSKVVLTCSRLVLNLIPLVSVSQTLDLCFNWAQLRIYFNQLWPQHLVLLQQRGLSQHSSVNKSKRLSLWGARDPARQTCQEDRESSSTMGEAADTQCFWDIGTAIKH